MNFYLKTLFICLYVQYALCKNFLLLKVVNKCFNEVSEKYKKFQVSSIDKYKSKIKNLIENSFNELLLQQMNTIELAQLEINNQIETVNKIYKSAINSLEKQREDIKNMKLPEIKIYDSLEQFRNEFNSKNEIALPQIFSNSKLPSEFWSSSQFSIKDFNANLLNQWESLVDTISKPNIFNEDSINKFKSDFTNFQIASNLKAKELMDESIRKVAENINKNAMQQEGRVLKLRYQNFTSESVSMANSYLKTLESKLKNLQDNISKSNLIYEELMNKRRNNVLYSNMNDFILNKVLSLIDPRDKGWKLIKEEGAIKVYQKFFSDTKVGGKFACVKSSHVINASPSEILQLLEDNSRVHQYNGLAERGTMRDIEVISDDTIIKWVKAVPIFPFKTREFCTLVHVRKLKDGTIVVLHRSTLHPAAPITPKYCRASIVLGANIIQPILGDPNRSKVTMLSQLDPGGIIPPMVINNICANGPIGFFKGVESSL